MPRVRGRSIEWLLALLVLRYGRTVDRSWLAGTIWFDSEESQALHNLRNALVYLRKALGSEGARIQSPSRDTLTLDLEGAEVDVLQFDVAIKARDEASLQSAVALYTGPLLEGCYEDWVTLERQSREQTCLTALETLAQFAEQSSDWSKALTLLRRAEAMDGLRDTTQRSLMRVLAASGDTPAALMTYREHRLRLRREMNVEPDTETTQLFQQLRTSNREGERTQKAEEPNTEDLNTRTPEYLNTENPTPKTYSSPAPLPHPLTALIGREQETCEIAQTLIQSRLVTLVGAGGVGKTRLAIQVARDFASKFVQEVAFVELASLSDPSRLPAFIAIALDIREEATQEPADLLQTLVGWLSAHDVLLVLDNCEHLIEAAASLIQSLLERSPSLRILTTSRQRLGLTGEVVWRVPSLSSPDPERLSPDAHNVTETVMEYPAVKLFVERAAMASSGLYLADTEDATAVARICHRLDGIPLAIELAAARVGILSVRQIAARLDDRFRLLTGGSRTALPRQRTLYALISWSYDLLTEAEQALLCQLSVFAGGWTLEAAEAITGSAGGTSHTPFPGHLDTLDLLTSLIDKSLVVSEAGQADIRYRMLETVREYTLEKLRQCGEEQTARGRHADHFLSLAEQAHPFLAIPDPAWLDRLETEYDNLLAALTFYAGQEEPGEKAVRLAAALTGFWARRGHFYEQRDWLLSLTSHPTAPTKARAELLHRAAWLVSCDKDFAGAKRMLTECLEIVRQLGDRREIARALHGLAGLISDPARAGPELDCVTALALAEESLAIVQELDDRQGMAHTLYMLGHLSWMRGDTNEARTRWMACHALDQELGVKGGYVLRVLGAIAQASGDYAAAHHFYGRYVTEQYEISDRWSLGLGLEEFCSLALVAGQPERAARLLEASLALRESIRPLSEEECTHFEALRNSVHEALGETALCALLAEGRGMTPEQAIDYALQTADESEIASG